MCYSETVVRSEVQTSTVEVDRVDEVLFVPECSSGIFHPLDLGVERFTGGTGNRGEGSTNPSRLCVKCRCRRSGHTSSYCTIHAGMVEPNEKLSRGGIIFPFKVPLTETVIW
jgi:hypothetical protein